jgi:hypothetical protein
MPHIKVVLTFEGYFVSDFISESEPAVAIQVARQLART